MIFANPHTNLYPSDSLTPEQMRGYGCQLTKELTLFFNAKWALEVKFFIEKKRMNHNLRFLNIGYKELDDHKKKGLMNSAHRKA